MVKLWEGSPGVYLEAARECVGRKAYAEAAVNAWWCVKYCEEGEPYGMSVEGMQSMIRESQAILRKCKKHFESSRLSKTTFVYGCICRRLL